MRRSRGGQVRDRASPASSGIQVNGPMQQAAPSPAPDEALFERITAGDQDAFAAFYDRHAVLLFSLALRIVGDHAEAEDVLQDSAIAIWERAPLYDSSHGRPLSWAVVVVRNKAVDRLRALRRRSGLAARAVGEMLATGSNGEDRAAAGTFSDIGEAVKRKLGELPEEQRQVLELAFFGGLSHSEIAGLLRQPLGTIKARIRRGMLAMRDDLEGIS